MIRTVEYPVLTNSVPARTSKARPTLLTDSIEADIPEFSASDLDMAAVITDSASGRQHPLFGLEGKLYSSISPIAPLEADLAFGHVFTMPDEQHRDPGQRPWSPLMCQYVDAIRQIGFDHGTQLEARLFPSEAARVVGGQLSSSRLGTKADYQFKEIDEAPFLYAREFMEEAVKNLLVIDGNVWRRCHAPVVSFIPLWGYQENRRISATAHLATLHVGQVDFAHSLGRDLRVISSATETEEGYALAAEISRHEHDFNAAVDLQTRSGGMDLEVRDPSYFDDQDTTTLGLVHAATRISWNISQNLLQKRGPYDGDQPAHERIMVNLAKASIEEIVVAKSIEDHLAVDDSYRDYTALADTVAKAADMSISYHARNIGLKDRALMLAAVDRWENRPISINQIGGGSPRP